MNLSTSELIARSDCLRGGKLPGGVRFAALQALTPG